MVDTIIKYIIDIFDFISTAYEIDRLRKHKTAHKIYASANASVFLHKMKVVRILRTCFIEI